MLYVVAGYVEECEKSTPVNYFWYRETLNITPNILSNGGLQWWLVVCLASAWGIVYICFIRGIETIGKVRNFLTTCLTYYYIIQLIIFIFINQIIKPLCTGSLCHSYIPISCAYHLSGPGIDFARSNYWIAPPFHTKCKYFLLKKL